MKEQEKQIEEMRIQRKLEMTKDISNGISGVLAYEIQKLAEHLISLNYVKLPEDSVVLSKEELQEHDKKLANDIITMFQKLAQNWASADIVNDTAKRLRKLYEV